MNVIVGDIASNQQLKDSNSIVSNGWQNCNHETWCPFYYHQSWCPIVRFNENIWTPNIESVLPTNEVSSYSSNWAQMVRPSNRLKKTSQQLKSVTPKHKVEKIYSCRLCDQMDETSDDFAFGAHLISHLETKAPFICQICTKEFPFRSTCRNHLMAHMVVRNRISRSAQSPQDRSILLSQTLSQN